MDSVRLVPPGSASEAVTMPTIATTPSATSEVEAGASAGVANLAWHGDAEPSIRCAWSPAIATPDKA
ncbi:hypothetical protein [Mycobacterium riyadhense]|uniref:hypothetical protein n=1 Tax=Mycobacterium riyadhense TaxID=486698 RepID=UPI00195807FB|nr:hypothetical protein [Mycobacterium riyadhense]